MAEWPLHPRLARFVLAAAEMGAKREACDLAARLSEGRPRFDQRSHASDIEALLAADLPYNARRLRQQLLDQVRVPARGRPDTHALEKALLLAFPDRVARKRGDRLLLAIGTAAQLDKSSFVHADYLVAMEVDDREGQTPLVRIASAIEPDWLLDLFPDSIETREELAWNRDAERVEQRNQLRYEQLVIDESSGPPTDSVAASEFLAAKAVEAGTERFCDAEELGKLMRRVQFAATYLKDELPADPQSAALHELAQGCTSFADMRAAGLLDVLQITPPYASHRRNRAYTRPTPKRPPRPHRISRWPSTLRRLPPTGFFRHETNSHRRPRRRSSCCRIARAQPTPGASNDRSRQLLEKSLSASSQRTEPPLSTTLLARKTRLITFVRQELPAHRNSDTVTFRILFTFDIHIEVDGAHDAVPEFFLNKLLERRTVHRYQFVEAINKWIGRRNCWQRTAIGYVSQQITLLIGEPEQFSCPASNFRSH